MSLPANKSEWPPAQWSPLFDMVTESAAWWQGDVNALRSQYVGAKLRPSQFDGGVVGATSRFFWGKPQLGGQAEKRVHAPLAADIAWTSASLLFDSPPTFTHDDELVQERLDALIDEGFAASLLVAGESCSALGGIYGRVQWDTSVSDAPWIEWVDADSAIPEWRHGKLVAVTFVDVLPKLDDGKDVYRLLSRYTVGQIEHTVYQGTDANIGIAVPLTAHPTTQNLLVHEGNIFRTGVNHMLCDYIPNARPVVGFRRDGQLRNMGRPDISPDIYPLLDALDEVWTKLMREIRLGQARITVPDYMLSNGRPGQPAVFDVDREIYDPMHTNPTEGVKPEFHQPTLRVDEHLRTAEALVREIIGRVNLSPISFGMMDTGSGTVTAREITAKWQASLQTWRAKSRYWRHGLVNLVEGLLHADALLHGANLQLDQRVQVQFAEPVQETELEKAQTIQALDSARAISTEEKVMRLHADWTPDEIGEETGRILSEQGIQAPLPELKLDEALDDM